MYKIKATKQFTITLKHLTKKLFKGNHEAPQRHFKKRKENTHIHTQRETKGEEIDKRPRNLLFFNGKLKFS